MKKKSDSSVNNIHKQDVKSKSEIDGKLDKASIIDTKEGEKLSHLS